MLLFQAFVLGLVQGLTEFLPVSSSGHLQAVPFLLGWAPGSLAFDVALHVGTLLAVVVYFRSDLWSMVRAVLRPRDDDRASRDARRLIAVLAVASVPAAVVGLFARDVIGAAFDEPLAVSAFLALTALLLWSSERRRARLGTVEPASGDLAAMTHELTTLPWSRVLGVGVSQALAILPGISRSGATISAGLALGMSRGAAARLSFLMLLPVTLGAAAVTLPELGTPEAGALAFSAPQIASGVAVSAVSGYLAIRLLLTLVARRGLTIFAPYVLLLAGVLAGVVLLRG
jgi:undecaprenyl-diphosphatase